MERADRQRDLLLAAGGIDPRRLAVRPGAPDRLPDALLVVRLAVQLLRGELDEPRRGRSDDRHSADLADAEYSDDPDEEPTILQRSTKELLYRLRKQVPSTRSAPRSSTRRSLGTGIFS